MHSFLLAILLSLMSNFIAYYERTGLYDIDLFEFIGIFFELQCLDCFSN